MAHADTTFAPENLPGDLIDMLPDGVWTARADGHLDYVNRAWRDYADGDAGASATPQWFAIIHPDDLPRFHQHWQAISASACAGALDLRLRRFDGSYHWFTLKARPLTDASGAVVKWCGLATALAEPATDAPSNKQDAYLLDIVDGIPVSIVLAYPWGGLEYANRYALASHGRTQEQLAGWKALDVLHPDDVDAAAAAWKHAVETGEPYINIHRNRHPDGSYRWMHVRGLPMRDGNGRITRWFLVNTDIDELKRREILLDGEKRLLEMVARNRPPEDILDAFCVLVEETLHGCRASIMLLDPSGNHMEHGAGPHLPTQYVSAITGCSLDAKGPCPMAVRLRRQVIVEDAVAQPEWSGTRWQGLAMAHGLRTCWSTPIGTAAGDALGVFAVYHDAPRSPSAQDAALIGQLTHIASLVIERMRNQMSLTRALAEVSASEDRLRSIVDAVPSHVWSAGLDGGADFLNQRWSQYSGLVMDDIRGYGWASTVHPDDAPGLADYWQATLAAGTPGEYEARLRRHDGIYRWFLFRAVPQRDGTGRVVKWYGANTDIEDRKQAEHLLAGEKDVLRLMAGGTPLAGILEPLCHLVEDTLHGALCSVVLVEPGQPATAADKSATLRLQTGAASRLPTALQEACIGPVVACDAHPVALAASSRLAQLLPDLAQEARWPPWCTLALSHGISAYWSIPIVAGCGTVTGVLSIAFRQVRSAGAEDRALFARFAHLAHIAIECARWEAALRRSEAFLAETQRLSLTGTFAWQVDTDEILWSDELYRIYEFDPDTKLSHALIDTRIHPDDRVMHQQWVERQKCQPGSFSSEHRLRMPDGRVKYLHLVANATQGENGELLYIAAVQDVTRYRLSEESQDKMRMELNHVARVAGLNVLTASIAHEVNQPLAGIITNASTCLRMLAAEPPNVDGARETARRTIRDGNRASEVIQRLRALFARKAFSSEPLDLGKAAREVVAMLQGELQRQGVSLQLELASGLPLVQGDRVQLQQVIVNLVVNAIDAMRAVTDRPRQLWIGTHRDDGDQVCLTVRDNGVGFHDIDAQRLFQAFYTTKDAGMGIGLSVSQSIVERHGGRLWASVNEGPGACFHLGLPACPGTDGERPSTPVAESSPTAGEEETR